MQTFPDWIIKAADPQTGQPIQSANVMAWARDTITGAPVYIGQLDKTRTGAACQCECPSCDLPLTAVNAAKTEFIKRPHFRHPDGAAKSECMYLAARLAALQLLLEQGVFQLPRRTMSGQVTGLSGFEHQAWVEKPPEHVRIREFNFSDRVAAVLTLDDGRQLRVQLVGSKTSATSSDPSFATIFLDVDESVASMTPQELKDRTTLVPDSLCWLSHWNDQALQVQAQEKARQLAAGLIDLEPTDAVFFDPTDPKFRHETLLHFEVKKILSESREIRVPKLQARVSKLAKNGKDVTRQWERPSQVIPLQGVQLERMFGRIIPDLITKVAPEHGHTLLIEVTVTNQISDERLGRIQLMNVPTLEINLSFCGGLITRHDLKKLVVQGLETKRWIHHPEVFLQEAILASEVDAVVASIGPANPNTAEYRQRVLETPLSEIAADYLNSVFSLAEYDREEVIDDRLREAIAVAKNYVQLNAQKLAIHGYPNANHDQLIGHRYSIIPRILSIKFGRGVGYRLDSTMAVMNAIRQTNDRNSYNHSLYLIAEKAYRPVDAQPHPTWYTYWVDCIKESTKSGESTYARDGTLDRLLSLLFPKMAAGLAHGFGKKQTRSEPDLHTTIQGFMAPRQAKPNTVYLDTPPMQVWLQGRDLERWRKEHPESAKMFDRPQDN